MKSLTETETYTASNYIRKCAKMLTVTAAIITIRRYSCHPSS